MKAYREAVQVESLTLEERPDASAESEAIARIKGAAVRRPGRYNS